jgi:hypothetical protein
VGGKPIIQVMVNYIGWKIIKIMLDLYSIYVVYLGIRDEK